MYTLKIILSMLIVILSLCIGWFWKTTERNTASDIGFGVMEFVYIATLIVFWT